MATNLNAELNLNPLMEKVLDNPFGVAVIIVIVVLALVIIFLFSFSKSGILTTIREHQEYKIRRVKEEIKDQEDLLEDEAFKKYKHQIKYHLDVLKLNKLLKYSHHDKDLLEYILSCKNTNSAMFYYESANQFIEKDEVSKKFKLRECFSTKYLNALNNLGSFIYFGISLGSLSPTVYVIYHVVKAGESIKNIPSSFFWSQFFLFIICLILALMLLSPFVKPWKANQFLELEKIENDQSKSNALDNAA